MTAPIVPSESRRIQVPEAVPRLLADLVHERTGLFFEPARFDTMLDKLEPRAAALGCPSFLDYYYMLKYDERGPQEWRRVMDVFAVQETYFWREFDQGRVLVEHIVPEWFRHTSRPLRIWSAACASGEEPYSLAIALQESGWGDHPIEIHASDASEAALARAEAAVYRERSFRALPAELRARYFERRPDGEALRRELIPPVSFRCANLVCPEEYEDLEEVHVLFCRNVFIYFSPAAITRVVSAFAERVPPAGYLFVGASESLLKLTRDFDLHEVRGAFAYRRRTGTAS